MVIYYTHGAAAAKAYIDGDRTIAAALPRL